MFEVIHEGFDEVLLVEVLNRREFLDDLKHRGVFGEWGDLSTDDAFVVEVVNPSDHIHHGEKLSDHKGNEENRVSSFLVVDNQHDIREVGRGLEGKERKEGVPNTVEEIEVVQDRTGVYLAEISSFSFKIKWQSTQYALANTKSTDKTFKRKSWGKLPWKMR